MLRSNITKTQEVVQTFLQTIIYSEKLNKSYVSARVPWNENLKWIRLIKSKCFNEYQEAKKKDWQQNRITKPKQYIKLPRRTYQ